MNELQEKERLRRFFITVFTVISVLGTIYAMKTICIDSPWRWSFSQPSFFTALAESVCLFLLLASAICVPRLTWTRLLLSFFVIFLFSFLHAMALVLLFMCLYAAMILLTGHLLLKAFCRRYEKEPLACIALGLAAIVVLVALCSLVKLGTPARLRIVYAVLFVIELILCHKQIFSLARAIFDKTREDRVRLSPEGWMLAATVSAFFIQVGRASISLDYDSLWYGLRSDAMLAPFTGIYDKVVSTGVAYSYPKGIETLSLAFNFEATHSFVYGVNLMLGAFALYTVYRVVRVFLDRRMSLFAALACAVTPGIMNMTVTAKSDIVTLLCQLLTVYFFVRALRERDGDAFLFAVAAALFSYCLKPSAVIFSSALLAVGVFLFFLQKNKFSPKRLGVLLAPVAANLVLMARTWMLTGVPVSMQLGSGIFKMLGFSYRFPHAPASDDYLMPSLSEFFTGEYLSARLPRLFRFFFSPLGEVMDHVIIAWGGILFAVAWFALVLLVFCRPKRTLAKIREDAGYAFSLLVTAVISAGSLATVVFLEKPDGNYYMLMYALTFLQLAIELRDLSEDFALTLYKRTIPMIAMSAALVLLTNWAWSLGFTPLKSEYNVGGYYNHAEENEDYYESLGISAITDRLAEEGGRRRVMVISSQEPKLLSIPAIAEGWLDISHWGNTVLSQSAEGLNSYFEASGMEYLLVEQAALEASGAENTVRSLLSLAQGGRLTVSAEGGGYYLLTFHQGGGTVDGGLVELLSFVLGQA